MFTIKNEYLTVIINEMGAALWSIKDVNSTEYLWQGNPDYWCDRAPNLFPYIARMTEGKYVLNGQTYEMDIHGFAKDMVFVTNYISKDKIILELCDNDATYRQYPYKFCFSIIYQLIGSKIIITYKVKNCDKKKMFFGVGGHPGFNVPFEENTSFDDYYLEFDSSCNAKKVIFSEDCFVTDECEDFVLENGTKLSLQHNMFDEDAIILKNMAKGVTLQSGIGKRKLHVMYPSMKYLGFWHMPKTNAPYICIEPWSSLPSRKGVIEDLSTQPGLLSLETGCEYTNHWSIEII